MALMFYLLAGLAALLSITSTVTATTYGQKLESSVLFNKTMPIHKYKTKTGMKVVIAKTGGPQVRGYVCLATNAHDDNGIPHCLEHLVFQGSEDYPYTGSLNLIANRCYAFGTNAFTAKDRTCYYSSHVGKNGFLALLPVFLDHILYPTLTKSTFTTEVYHVTGEGEDGGVVFSEMEAASVDYNWRALLRTVHKDSGYASDTGGSLPNLRENTTHQQNVAYHKKFYRPENLCITVLGDVSIDDVMKSIQKVEKKIASKPKLPRWTRPWKVRLPALKTTTVKTLLPASNEGATDIYIAWRAPNPVVRFRKLTAFEYLLPYLASSAKPEDFYSSSVTGGVYDFTLYFHFFDVPLDKTHLVYPALIKWLRKYRKSK
ncbi:uncharacterized protein C05D11.1-like [Bradysia coprophila]|uniref:uncharacterized protein C05D11.1-like n=1 Tax=Bradysia coprophila TaxID=38358 RepID=UPI00187DB3F2|nr:uncharacterized protein C05D11.1-like [Bradysia coprophila]